jgi:hypothetical protein
MPVQVDLCGIEMGADAFILNLDCSAGTLRHWITPITYTVNWKERWIYQDGIRFFPVDSLGDLLEWVMYCETSPETSK